MLLQNNTEILFSLNVNLVFDTGETKQVNVNVDDYLLLKFTYDGSKYTRACQVADIVPVMLSTQPISYSANMILDCSGKFQAERLTVATKDILDIRKVSEDYVLSLAPDYVITDDMFDGDYIPSVPPENYMIPGIDAGGVEFARILR